MRLVFDWDNDKNAKNKRKHKISFEAASRVFADPLCNTKPDPEHSHGDERFRTIGDIGGVCYCVVIHSMQEVDDDFTLVRIISARKLDKSERKDYEHDL